MTGADLQSLIADMERVGGLARFYEMLVRDHNEAYAKITAPNIQKAFFDRIRFQEGFKDPDLPRKWREFVDAPDFAEPDVFDSPKQILTIPADLGVAYAGGRIERMQHGIVGGEFSSGDISFVKSVVERFSELIPNIAKRYDALGSLQTAMLIDGIFGGPQNVLGLPMPAPLRFHDSETILSVHKRFAETTTGRDIETLVSSVEKMNATLARRVAFTPEQGRELRSNLEYLAGHIDSPIIIDPTSGRFPPNNNLVLGNSSDKEFDYRIKRLTGTTGYLFDVAINYKTRRINLLELEAKVESAVQDGTLPSQSALELLRSVREGTAQGATTRQAKSTTAAQLGQFQASSTSLIGNGAQLRFQPEVPGEVRGNVASELYPVPRDTVGGVLYSMIAPFDGSDSVITRRISVIVAERRGMNFSSPNIALESVSDIEAAVRWVKRRLAEYERLNADADRIVSTLKANQATRNLVKMTAVTKNPLNDPTAFGQKVLLYDTFGRLPRKPLDN